VGPDPGDLELPVVGRGTEVEPDPGDVELPVVGCGTEVEPTPVDVELGEWPVPAATPDPPGAGCDLPLEAEVAEWATADALAEVGAAGPPEDRGSITARRPAQARVAATSPAIAR
jgi:hypothetical protein